MGVVGARGPRAGPSGRRVDPLALIGAVLTAVITGLIASGRFTFGSEAGRWVLRYFPPDEWRAALSLAIAIPSALALARLTHAQIERREHLVIFVGLIAGFLLQLVLRLPYFAPLDVIIRSNVANGYYGQTLEYGFLEYLNNFDVIPRHHHVGANMTGKVVFYYLMGAMTRSPEMLGLLIIAFSNLGAVLVYLIARELFGDRRSALFALVLYLFLPCKLFFFPLLNTVSPVFILLCFYLELRFLRDPHWRYAALLGASLYACIFFEPLPLAMGIVFAAFLVRGLRTNQVDVMDLWRLAAVAAGVLGALHVVVRVLTGYDLIADLLSIVHNALRFHRGADRPYAIWVWRNLVDFWVNFGVCQAVVVLGGVLRDLRRVQVRGDVGRGGRILDPATLLSVSCLLVLCALDAVGITRGEVERLWIFLACFLLFPLARACAARPGLATFSTVLACVLLQAGVAISRVQFVLSVSDVPVARR